MIEVLAAARGRAHALRVEAAIVSHEESHSPDCGCPRCRRTARHPDGPLEDDLAGADQ
jgi:transposase-like protein